MIPGVQQHFHEMSLEVCDLGQCSK